MSNILNEIFANFEEFEAEQKAIEKPTVDNRQFDLLNSEANLTDEPAYFLENSILITADENDSNDILLEKKIPFGKETEDMVQKAHPETVMIADGPERSGVVDNQNEQQEKIINMVNKQPTGNVFNNFSFAEEIRELTAIANELDSEKLFAEADALTHVANDLNRLKKKIAEDSPFKYFQSDPFDQPKTPPRPSSWARGLAKDAPIDLSSLTDAGTDIAVGVGAGKAVDMAGKAKGIVPAPVKLPPMPGAPTGKAKWLSKMKGLFSKVVPFLGAGAAGLATPHALVAAAVLAIAAGGYSILNGMVDNIDEDLNDFKLKVKDYLADSEYSSNPALVKYLNSMLGLVASMEQQATILHNKDMISKWGAAHSTLNRQILLLRAEVEMFKESAEGFLPSVVQFHLLNEKLDNLEVSVEEFVDEIVSYAKLAGVSLQSVQAPAGQTSAPTSSPGDSSNTRAIPAEPKKASEADVREMQEHLLRVPDSFWNKAGFTEMKALDEKGADGIMDGLTRAALDAYANYISDDLGIANLTGPRLEELGNGSKLREIWNVYRRPDKYMSK